jgi:hypothetical protein
MRPSRRRSAIPCFVENLDVARNARLALPQNLYDFADGKLQLPYQQRDSHPRRIGKRAHYVEQGRHWHGI